MTRSPEKPMRRRSASPRARRWSRAGTRNSSAGWSRGRRSTRPRPTRVSCASTPRIFRSVIRPSWRRLNRNSRGNDRAKPARISLPPCGRGKERRNFGMTVQGPLAGLKVVELAHIMAGPVCGLMLADMGASVIKVEKIPGGDDSRRFLPPAIGGESAAFMMMNRNKRGIALDLKHPAGKNVLRRLLPNAEVLIENYRSDTMAKLGFGYEDLRKSNPGLIYCALSGFGRTGPYAELGGFDLIAQGMSGLMSITGEGPGRQPVKSGAPVTDITAGILAAMGVLAAYVHRLKTGEGQMVDT